MLKRKTQNLIKCLLEPLVLFYLCHANDVRYIALGLSSNFLALGGEHRCQLYVSVLKYFNVFNILFLFPGSCNFSSDTSFFGKILRSS